MAVRNVILLLVGFGGACLCAYVAGGGRDCANCGYPADHIGAAIACFFAPCTGKLGGLSAEAEEVSAIRTVHAFAQEKQMRRFGMTLQAALDAALARVRLRAILSGLFYDDQWRNPDPVGRWARFASWKDQCRRSLCFCLLCLYCCLFYRHAFRAGRRAAGAAGAADRIAQLLGQPLRRTDPVQPHLIIADKGVKIRFENVDFAYPSRGDIPALKG